MKKIVLLSVVILFSCAISAQVQDFTGTWKLNTGKSILGDQFSLAPREIIVSQNGNDMTVEKHSDFQGEAMTTTDKLTLDGKECINTAWQDAQKKSTAVWSDDARTLTVTSKLNIGEAGDITIVEIFKMDAANMVLVSNASSSYGDLAETMVYDKQ